MKRNRTEPSARQRRRCCRPGRMPICARGSQRLPCLRALPRLRRNLALPLIARPNGSSSSSPQLRCRRFRSAARRHVAGQCHAPCAGRILRTVASFRFEAMSGVLTLEGVTSILPPGSSLLPGSARGAGGGAEPDRSRAVWCADIRISPMAASSSRRNGRTAPSPRCRWRRGRNACRHIAYRHGEAAARHRRRSDGPLPRGVRRTLGPIACYAIDPADGRLSPLSSAPVSAGANWVEIVRPGSGR